MAEFTVVAHGENIVQRSTENGLVHDDANFLWVDSQDKLVLVITPNGHSLCAVCMTSRGFRTVDVVWPIRLAPPGRCWALTAKAYDRG